MAGLVLCKHRIGVQLPVSPLRKGLTMEEKCEKIVPEDVLLGIANFIDLVPCKVPEKKEDEEKKAIAKTLTFSTLPLVV